MKYINELIERLEDKKIRIHRSTKEQMQSLYFIVDGKKLPMAYVEFMDVMGNGTENGFMGGDSCFMDEIHDLKQGAIELLQENESENVLNDEDFVFWMSQGCMFCFFNLKEGDNPPVYFYNESGDDKFIKIADSLVEFLINRFEMNKTTFREK